MALLSQQSLLKGGKEEICLFGVLYSEASGRVLLYMQEALTLLLLYLF